jgi:hypothetical protein
MSALLVLIAGPLLATTVSVSLISSTNAGLSGGVVSYYDAGWHTVGTTPANGVLTFTYSGTATSLRVTMNYLGTTKELIQDVSLAYVFQTKLMKVNLINSSSNGLSNGSVTFYSSGWKTMGTTDASGFVQLEMLPATYNFSMVYYGAVNYKSVDISSVNPLTFQTINMQVGLFNSVSAPLSGGLVKYYASGWQTIGTTDATGSTSKELLPGTYSFTMSYGGASVTQNVDITTTNPYNFNTQLVTVKLQSSNGTPVSGGLAKYYASGWNTIGTTNASGQITVEILPGTFSFTMSLYGYTEQQSSINIVTSPVVLFTTISVSVRIQDCNQNGVANGLARFYASGWNTIGTTGANGLLVQELLPGNYDFMMTLLGQSNQTGNITISATNNVVTFTTTTVKVQYSGVVKFYASGWQTYSNPTEMLQANYKFKFDSREEFINVTGCEIKRSFAHIKVLNSGGGGIAGVPIKCYDSGWKTAGSTDAGGNVYYMWNNIVTNASVNAVYLGGNQTKSQNIAVNSIVVFQTTNVLVELRKGDGSLGYAGGLVKYYASGWKVFGTTDATGTVSLELLPLSYSFSMTYLGGTIYQTVNTALNTTVTFGTVTVTVELRKGDASLGYDGGDVKYYASGWKVFGTTGDFTTGTTQKDLLPLSYNFSMNYDGGTNYITQYIASPNNTVSFGTQSVTVRLLKADGTVGWDGGNVKYYASGWKVFGTTGDNVTGIVKKDLLPNSYNFSMNYGGGTNYITQNITAPNNVVDFQTEQVFVKLLKGDGTTGYDGGVIKYYASGWKSFGTTGDLSTGVASKELLPNSYNFSMNYLGGTNYITQNITSPNNTVVFGTQTTTVKLEDCNNIGIAGGDVKYYASGWKVFGTTDATGYCSLDLLPNSYNFAMKHLGKTNYITQNIGTTPTVVFTTTKVNIQFSGITKFYSSGWKVYSQPMEMLAGTYTFIFDGMSTSVNISGCLVEKSVAIVQLKSSTGAGLAGGDAVYYYYPGPDANIGTTPSSGKLLCIIDAIKSSVMFKMTYAAATQVMTQDIAANSWVVFQTTMVTFQLKNSAGVVGGAGEATDLKYYKYPSESVFGSGTTSSGYETMELLPLAYDFRMKYKGHITSKSQDVNIDPTVIFQTTLVTMNMKDHLGVVGGAGEADGLEYYKYPLTNAFGAGVTTSGTETMELLPLTYEFRLKYKGHKTVKTQDVTVNPVVEFQTVMATMELRDHLGNLMDQGFNLAAYRYPTTTIFGAGVTTGGAEAMQLLPLQYEFRMTYDNCTKTITQNIGTNGTVTFSTILVTLEFRDHNNTLGTGTLLTAEGTNLQSYKYPTTTTFASGTTSSGAATDEMFPSVYEFRLTYGGATQLLSQDVASNPTVVFQTGYVTDVDANCTHYYKYPNTLPFVNNMELLPFTYEFRFTDRPNTNYSVTAGAQTVIPSLGSPRIAPGDGSAEMMQNYPNPFSDYTEITYTIDNAGHVGMRVYDQHGRLVSTLVNSNQIPGEYTVTWNGTNDSGGRLANGVYFIVMQTSENIIKKPCMIQH